MTQNKSIAITIPTIPKWLIPILILLILTLVFGNSIINGLHSLQLTPTSKAPAKIEKGFDFKDNGQKIAVTGSNLLLPGSVNNTEELNDKVTKVPGTSYIQDNDNFTVISVSAKKEDIGKISAQAGELVVNFRVVENGQDIKIYADSKIPQNIKRISLSSALFSNLRPAPDSYIKNSSVYIENAIGKEAPLVYKKQEWDKSQTIYVRIWAYKIAANI